MCESIIKKLFHLGVMCAVQVCYTICACKINATAETSIEKCSVSSLYTKSVCDLRANLLLKLRKYDTKSFTTICI